MSSGCVEGKRKERKRESKTQMSHAERERETRGYTGMCIELIFVQERPGLNRKLVGSVVSIPRRVTTRKIKKRADVTVRTKEERQFRPSGLPKRHARETNSEYLGS